MPRIGQKNNFGLGQAGSERSKSNESQVSFPLRAVDRRSAAGDRSLQWMLPYNVSSKRCAMKDGYKWMGSSPGFFRPAMSWNILCFWPSRHIFYILSGRSALFLLVACSVKTSRRVVQYCWYQCVWNYLHQSAIQLFLLGHLGEMLGSKRKTFSYGHRLMFSAHDLSVGIDSMSLPCCLESVVSIAGPYWMNACGSNLRRRWALPLLSLSSI